MRRLAAIICLLLLCPAQIVQADSHLVPTLDDPPGVCPDRPPEPAWLRNIAPREAYKRLLVQHIYRARSMQRIVDAGACSCPTRYPSWEAAEAVFVEQFTDAGYWAVTEATSDYRREANRLRLEAMPICEEAGNW